MPQRRRVAGRTAAVVATFMVSVALVPMAGGCSSGSGDPPRLQPLGSGHVAERDGAEPDRAATSDSPPSGAADLGDDAGEPVPAPTPDPAGPATGGAASPRNAAEAEVDELLARYDAALTALSAEPGAVTDPAHPLTLAWHSVVASGSALDSELRGRIHSDLVDRRMVIHPGAEGTSYRTLAITVSETPDGSLGWTHCGYSPGVGVNATTGEVLDDRRASTRGSGRAQRMADGSLVVVELHDDGIEMLEPGEADPCPPLQAASREGDRP